ncbi:MAG: hypothetical protein ACI8R4_004074 [Paracoccaceae bacterium]|jgi:hypothetical protein
MDTDLALILGILVAGFSLPSLASSISEARAPRTAMILIVIAGALVLYALTAKPGGYTMKQLPDVFFGVIARFIP